MQSVVSEMIEFLGPNYNDNGYSKAKYRRSTETSTIFLTTRNVEVPQRLEALANDGSWQQHPVVFMHYGSYENQKEGRGNVIMFDSDGHTSTLYGCGLINVVSPRDVLHQAERLGLTHGSLANVKAIMKE